MAKIYNYKLAKHILNQLLDDEEETEEEYFINHQFVSKDDGRDGKEILSEYNSKMSDLEEKREEERKEAGPVLANLLNRSFTGKTRKLTRSMNLRLESQSQKDTTRTQKTLNELKDRLEKIRSSELRTYFRVRDGRQAALDTLSDDIFEVANYNLCNSRLFEIADKQIGCDLDFDIRNY